MGLRSALKRGSQPQRNKSVSFERVPAPRKPAEYEVSIHVQCAQDLMKLRTIKKGLLPPVHDTDVWCSVGIVGTEREFTSAKAPSPSHVWTWDTHIAFEVFSLTDSVCIKLFNNHEKELYGLLFQLDVPVRDFFGKRKRRVETLSGLATFTFSAICTSLDVSNVEPFMSQPLPSPAAPRRPLPSFAAAEALAAAEQGDERALLALMAKFHDEIELHGRSHAEKRSHQRDKERKQGGDRDAAASGGLVHATKKAQAKRWSFPNPLRGRASNHKSVMERAASDQRAVWRMLRDSLGRSRQHKAHSDTDIAGRNPSFKPRPQGSGESDLELKIPGPPPLLVVDEGSPDLAEQRWSHPAPKRSPKRRRRSFGRHDGQQPDHQQERDSLAAFLEEYNSGSDGGGSGSERGRRRSSSRSASRSPSPGRRDSAEHSRSPHRRRRSESSGGRRSSDSRAASWRESDNSLAVHSNGRRRSDSDARDSPMERQRSHSAEPRPQQRGRSPSASPGRERSKDERRRNRHSNGSDYAVALWGDQE